MRHILHPAGGGEVWSRVEGVQKDGGAIAGRRGDCVEQMKRAHSRGDGDRADSA